MKFLQNLSLLTVPSKSVLLIDISADSVAGAYAYHGKSGGSVVPYAQRLPIEIRTGEPRELAMARTFLALGNVLVREGAPALERATGHGRVDYILVSVDAPWSIVQIKIKHVSEKDPFVFTPELMATVFTDIEKTAGGKILTDQGLIGTRLNGYETRNPYGKMARHATAVILASYIEKPVTERITTTLRELFHREDLSLVAASSLRYRALRSAFPHERDACVLDVIGSSVSIALVQKDILVSITEVSDVMAVTDEMKKLVERFGAPRTIFLLASESKETALRQSLFGVSSSKIISVLPSHLIGLVRNFATTPPDMSLLLMALYSRPRA